MTSRLGHWGRRRRAEIPVAAAFGTTTAAAIGLAVVYGAGGQPQLEGVLLAVAFGALAYGLVRWANELLDGRAVTQARHTLASTPAEREEVDESFDRDGLIERRSFLFKSLGAAVGALGLASLFPIRSLGPRPGRALLETPWRAGTRLVNEAGVPVAAADVPLGGLVTVFPEGHAGSADGQAVLVRVEPALLRPRRGREHWSPEGLVCYSKICTHAGCPVGLYEAQEHQLLCPCHQSTFDVLRGAAPVFGPADAPLPQLPLRLAPGGGLEAGGDFSDPVGPAFWRRG